MKFSKPSKTLDSIQAIEPARLTINAASYRLRRRWKSQASAAPVAASTANPADVHQALSSHSRTASTKTIARARSIQNELAGRTRQATPNSATAIRACAVNSVLYETQSPISQRAATAAAITASETSAANTPAIVTRRPANQLAAVLAAAASARLIQPQASASSAGMTCG